MGRNKREIVRAIGPIKVERKRRRNSVLEDSLTDRLESFADESMTPSEKRLPSSEGPEMRKIIMKILKNPGMSDKLKCEILTRLSKRLFRSRLIFLTFPVSLSEQTYKNFRQNWVRPLPLLSTISHVDFVSRDTRIRHSFEGLCQS